MNMFPSHFTIVTKTRYSVNEVPEELAADQDSDDFVGDWSNGNFNLRLCEWHSPFQSLLLQAGTSGDDAWEVVDAVLVKAEMAMWPMARGRGVTE